MTLVATLLLSLTGCRASTYQEGKVRFADNKDFANEYFTIISEWGDFNTKYIIVYDNEEKVKYFVFHDVNASGITPLYNSDGTLQIYNEN